MKISSVRLNPDDEIRILLTIKTAQSDPFVQPPIG